MNEAIAEIVAPQAENDLDDFDFSTPVSALFSRPAIAEPHSPPPERPSSEWYLGIDFGTTALSAALVNRQSGKLYPLYWVAENAESRFSFRLPSVAYLSSSDLQNLPQVAVESVGELELTGEAGGLLLQNFKLPLKVGIPYQAASSLTLSGDLDEPALQWSEQQVVSLAWLLQALRALLATFKPQENKSSLRCQAVGLESNLLKEALEKLGGVILGTPAGWSEAYRFNLREAVLGAGLVKDSSHIFAIEDAIATLLSELPLRSEEATSDRSSQLKGGTLILNAGAVTTELALVKLPENLQDLTYSDFTCQSFAYGGNALDQDIICQLLMQGENFLPPGGIPQAGEPDLVLRYQLHGWLQSSSFGQKLLEAAQHLKVILQHQERFAFNIGSLRFEVKRRELESKVLVPFVQRLNRELNALLSQVGMSPVAIEQAICTGGNASWPAIARWLRQKLPNAILIQDRELEMGGWEPGEITIPTQISKLKSKIGRVAWGLASLPLYPHILDVPRQQYNDYFLLWELMRVVGKQRLNLGEIMQLLESRGINTRTCQSRILAILEGNLPPGLFPSTEDAALLTQNSRQNPDCEAVKALPLFHKELDRDYCLNLKQKEKIQHYLSRLMAGSKQKLQEPLTVDFGMALHRSQ